MKGARRVLLPVFVLGVITVNFIQAQAIATYAKEEARKKNPRELSLLSRQTDEDPKALFALTIDFERLVLTEGPPTALGLPSLSSLTSSSFGSGPIKLPLYQVVRALRHAQNDDRVIGLVGQFGVGAQPSLGGASSCEELASAIREFQHMQRRHYDPKADRDAPIVFAVNNAATSDAAPEAASTAAPARRATCSKGHPLKYTTVFRHAHVCDECEGTLSSAVENGRCDECDFDLCQSCSLNLPAAVPEVRPKFSVAYADSLSYNLIGASAPSVLNTYLALQFAETYVHPTGYVTPPLGLSASTPFLSLFFKKYGIHAQFLKCSEFKNAPNTFTESSYTPAHLYATASMLSSLDDSLIRGVLRSKNLSLVSAESELVSSWIRDVGTCPAELCERACEGVLLKSRSLHDVWHAVDERYGPACVFPKKIIAVDPPTFNERGECTNFARGNGAVILKVSPDRLKLEPWEGILPDDGKVVGRTCIRTVSIDEYIKYVDAVEKKARMNQRLDQLMRMAKALYWADKTPEAITISRKALFGELVRYLGAPSDVEKMTASGQPQIPIIRITGSIDRGFSEGRGKTGSRTVVDLLRSAALDPSVKGIVLRVDSPGGSAISSDIIHSAIADFKKAGKPVVVSMAGYGASGGYYVSCNADRIFANRTTLTGSIGVFGGKFSVGRLLRKYGIGIGEVGMSLKAMADSPFHDYSDDDKQRLQASMDLCYSDFKKKVAAGRGLTLEQVEEIAKGRVWTGAQALEKGLVDEIGGLDDALNYIQKKLKEEGKIPEKTLVIVSDWPRPQGLMAMIGEMLRKGEEPSAKVLEGRNLINGDGKIIESVVAKLLEETGGARGRGMKSGEIMLLNVEVDVDYS